MKQIILILLINCITILSIAQTQPQSTSNFNSDDEDFAYLYRLITDCYFYNFDQEKKVILGSYKIAKAGLKFSIQR